MHVQACLEEAKGNLDVAANHLAELFGNDSQKGSLSVGAQYSLPPVDPLSSDVNVDDLSPDDYLLWEQEQLGKQDIYISHRKEAFVETRAWQRAANRCELGQHLMTLG